MNIIYDVYLLATSHGDMVQSSWRTRVWYTAKEGANYGGVEDLFFHAPHLPWYHLLPFQAATLKSQSIIGLCNGNREAKHVCNT